MKNKFNYIFIILGLILIITIFTNHKIQNIDSFSNVIFFNKLNINNKTIYRLDNYSKRILKEYNFELKFVFTEKTKEVDKFIINNYSNIFQDLREKKILVLYNKDEIVIRFFNFDIQRDIVKDINKKVNLKFDKSYKKHKSIDYSFKKLPIELSETLKSFKILY